MDEQAILVARVLFWVLATLVFVLPLRWALFPYLLLAHLDLSGPAFPSASSIGIENAIKTLALPTVFLFRAGFRPLRYCRWQLPVRFWTLIVLYAAVATLWSPFKLSAIKMVGYLCCYLLLFLIFSYSWQAGWLNLRMVYFGLWAALVLAVLQTYVLGGRFGGPENRFTSFTSPQYFAAYLACSAAILLFSDRGSVGPILGVLAASVGIALSGSRYVFIGLLLLFGIVAVAAFLGTTGRTNRLALLRRSFVGLVLITTITAVFLRYLPEHRLSQAVDEAVFGVQGSTGLGTFRWRVGIYGEVVDDISRRSFPELVLGSGTSSGAQLLLSRDSRYWASTIDANRALHNEILRSFYEWGLLGGALVIAFILSTAIGFLILGLAHHRLPAFAVIGMLPTIMISLGLENIFAGAASPAGVGFVLLLSYAAVARGAPQPQWYSAWSGATFDRPQRQRFVTARSQISP